MLVADSYVDKGLIKSILPFEWDIHYLVSLLHSLLFKATKTVTGLRPS